MPIYEYNCPKCQDKFELLRPISRAEDDAECPKCSCKSKRALSRFIAKSALDFSALNHMPASSGGSSCGSCSSSSCSTCGK